MATEGIGKLKKERLLKSSRTKFFSRAQVTVKAKVCPVSTDFCPQLLTKERGIAEVNHPQAIEQVRGTSVKEVSTSSSDDTLAR
jgi:hypothetical protein